MNNYLDGYDRNEVTLEAEDSVEKGKAVSMADNFMVRAAESGEKFIGICTQMSNYSAGILLKGFITVPFTGDAPECGYEKLVADGNGGVKKGTDGRDILIVEVDTDAMTCGIIL